MTGVSDSHSMRNLVAATSLLLMLAGCDTGSSSGETQTPLLLDRVTTSATSDEAYLGLYNLRSIPYPITSFPGLGGPAFPGCTPEDPSESPPTPVAAIDGDELAAFLKSQCRRDGARVAYREGGILLVSARPDDHKRVAGILRWLRSPWARRVFAGPLGRPLAVLLARAI